MDNDEGSLGDWEVGGEATDPDLERKAEGKEWPEKGDRFRRYVCGACRTPRGVPRASRTSEKEPSVCCWQLRVNRNR